MRASIGDPMFRGLSSEDLTIRYIASSIVCTARNVYHLSKLEVLFDLPLLFDLSARLVDRLHEKTTAICALASSGLAIGVTVALVAKVPVTFFHRAGFPRPEAHGLGTRFRPDRKADFAMTLIDSHERSRYSSALCYEDLFASGLGRPVQVLVPYAFDMQVDPNYTIEGIDYSSIMLFSDAEYEVAKSLGISLEILRSLVENPQSELWAYPPYDLPKESSVEFSVPGIKWRPRWFLGFGTDLSIVKSLSPRLKGLCSQINPSDDGIWDFFLNPDFIRDFALEAGIVLNLANYDHLVGVGHLGISMAIALAYYNQDKFHGTIITHLGDYGLLPRPERLAGKKILPIEMRIKTGVFAVDVYKRIQQLGGEINRYVSVFPPLEPQGRFEISRQSSIGRLVGRGIEFVSLA